MSFDFNLLSDVGEPWHGAAKQSTILMANSHDAYIVEGATIYKDRAEHFTADILVPKSMEPYNIITVDTRTGEVDLVEIILIENYDGNPYGDTVPRSIGSNQCIKEI